MNNRPNIAIDEQQLSELVDVFFAKVLDDYRINRYFYARPFVEQTAPLKRLAIALLGASLLNRKHCQH